MAERSALSGDKRLFEGQIIPFRNSGGAPPARIVAGAQAIVLTRTLRPVDVLLLMPLILPMSATFLLGLLGWFVAWLSIVGFLVSVIVFRDLARTVRGRLSGPSVRAPIGYHGR